MKKATYLSTTDFDPTTYLLIFTEIILVVKVSPFLSRDLKVDCVVAKV